jgi:hypothetical protein
MGGLAPRSSSLEGDSYSPSGPLCVGLELPYFTSVEWAWFELGNASNLCYRLTRLGVGQFWRVKAGQFCGASNLWSAIGTAPQGRDVVVYSTLRFYLP